MKVHPVNFLIALVIAALITYGLVSLDSNTMKGAIGVGGFTFLSITLSVAIGLNFRNVRSGVNIKVAAFFFFVIALVVNGIFSFFELSLASYVISSGIIFMLFILIANSIFSTEQ